MDGARLRQKLGSLWGGSAITVILATLYPTVFVLSQNWYALSTWQSLWLLGVSILSGAAVFAAVEGAFRLSGWRPAAGPAASEVPARAVALGLVCAGLFFFLLIATLRHAVPYTVPLVAGYFALAAAFAWFFLRGLQRYVNTFLVILVAVASSAWILSATTADSQVITGARPDFEDAKFRTRPNIYLFIYDAYGSDDVYKKVFNFDNSTQYAELKNRGFKIIGTFSNYASTWQTTIATFLGRHHYYETATGNADSQSGRPMMAGFIHNPVLQTLRNNGYRLQYVHGIDYFVNEPGVIEFVYPQGTALSALRVFGNPVLNNLGGRKRRVSFDTQKAILYARIQPPAGPAKSPWFTFAHVNLPSHGPSGEHWTRLGAFEQTFRDRTVQANSHMLETIDRIKAEDPEAVIIIFGDHGALRYNKIWGSGDPHQGFRSAGVPAEVVALDTFGIMIAIHSGGLCDDYAYPGMTPVNIMRTVFACLAGDRKLMGKKAADITLFRRDEGVLRLVAKDGVALPNWEIFRPER